MGPPAVVVNVSAGEIETGVWCETCQKSTLVRIHIMGTMAAGPALPFGVVGYCIEHDQLPAT
jgi:hypothetical protein